MMGKRCFAGCRSIAFQEISQFIPGAASSFALVVSSNHVVVSSVRIYLVSQLAGCSDSHDVSIAN